jgi:hypothetical protein
MYINVNDADSMIVKAMVTHLLTDFESRWIRPGDSSLFVEHFDMPEPIIRLEFIPLL